MAGDPAGIFDWLAQSYVPGKCEGNARAEFLHKLGNLLTRGTRLSYCVGLLASFTFFGTRSDYLGSGVGHLIRRYE